MTEKLMEEKPMRMWTRFSVVGLGLLLLGLTGQVALAQQPAPPASVETQKEAMEDLQLTRVMIQAERQAIVTRAMDLTTEEMQTFWPVYREYRGALAKVGDRFVSLVENYAKSYEKMTDAQAQPIIDEMFAIQKEELKIKMDWLPKLGKVLPPATLARFLQIENKLDAIIRFELADEIPLVEPAPKGK